MENAEERAKLSENQKNELWRTKEQRRHLKRQLLLTDKLLRLLEKALEDERELYRYVHTTKSGGDTEAECVEMNALNEDRLAKIVKALSELIFIQHDILAIPHFKESADAENTKSKLLNDRDISLRKIELELLKVDSSDGQAIPEQLLAALGGDCDDP